MVNKSFKMKKTIIFFCLFFMFYLSSCKKDYTCVCTIDFFEYSEPLEDYTHSEARKKCDKIQEQYEAQSSLFSWKYVECELK
jgi:alkyl hydroperoxide reductase subunit AhpC